MIRRFAGNREEIISQATDAAINLLLEILPL